MQSINAGTTYSMVQRVGLREICFSIYQVDGTKIIYCEILVCPSRIPSLPHVHVDHVMQGNIYYWFLIPSDLTHYLQAC